MLTLVQLTERVHVYRGGVNFTVLIGDGGSLILVDSGLDSGNARKALRPFLESGYTLKAIINTHSHSDHIGGNADLVRRTGCQVWAPARERPFILWPELEPLGLYGGAFPPPSLQVKFLQAQPTPLVLELPEPPGPFMIEGLELELVPLPGHAWDQVAVSVDGVLVAADGLFKPEVIEKHPVIFVVNVAQYLSSLDRLAERPERLIVPGHGDVVDRRAEGEDPLPQILAANKVALGRIQEAILAELQVQLTGEELLYRVAARLDKVIDNDPQFFLDRAAISAHVSDLIHRAEIRTDFVNGKRFLSHM